MAIAERPIQCIQVGQRSEVERKITEEMITNFAWLSLDQNPLHMDADYARRTRFRERIAHGMLCAGFISAALAAMSGCESTLIYRQQTLRFHRPVKIGDTVRAVAEVTAVEQDGMIYAATSCRNQYSKLIIDGEAIGLADPYPYEDFREV